VIARDWMGEAMPATTSVRIEPCPACRGDKGHAYPIDIDRRDGSLIEGWQDCSTCGAEGEIEVELEPIELDDLVDALIPTEAIDIIMTEAINTGQCLYFLANDGKLYILRDDEMEPVL
jgi:hypothetical protein